MTAWRMPIEGHPQERLWMAWPSRGYTLGATAADADAARRAWAGVANAAAEWEPVTMLCDPSSLAAARPLLGRGVDIVPVPLDDAWMRDIGPSFVLGANGRLGAVDWVFNGWGQQEWASWGRDAHVARIVADLAGAETIASPLVNEGGGIQVDGTGRVIVTRTVQLDPHRNPGLTAADVEAELARCLGADTAIWLPRGLTRDTAAFGTRGHADILAVFASPNLVLYHDQRDPQHPDHAVSAQIRSALEAARERLDAHWEFIPLPAPRRLRDAEGFVDYSYVNHVVVNDAVLLGTFDDPADATAAGILAEAYPGRRIMPVDAREIFARGGGVHCVTQQQPATEPGQPALEDADQREDRT